MAGNFGLTFCVTHRATSTAQQRWAGLMAWARSGAARRQLLHHRSGLLRRRQREFSVQQPGAQRAGQPIRRGNPGRGQRLRYALGAAPPAAPLLPRASFDGTNGSFPFGGVLRDAQGNLYSTTQGGGANGNGTIGKLAAGSSTITALASFNSASGSFPGSSLVRDGRAISTARRDSAGLMALARSSS